jgi:putative glutamine amidotransferase
MGAPRIGITFAAVGSTKPEKEALYAESVRRAGGEPVALRPGDEARIPALLRECAGFVFSGGDDVAPEYYGEAPHPALGPVDPARDRLEVLLARAAAAEDRPVLGICKGLQVLNVALGGALVQDIPSQVSGAGAHGGMTRHAVTVEPGTLLSRVVGEGTYEVNSSHHQAASRLGRGLRIAARSPDGVTEALERPGARFLLAVQWHPEREGCTGRTGDAVVAALVEAARASPR